MNTKIQTILITICFVPAIFLTLVRIFNHTYISELLLSFYPYFFIQNLFILLICIAIFLKLRQKLLVIFNLFTLILIISNLTFGLGTYKSSKSKSSESNLKILSSNLYFTNDHYSQIQDVFEKSNPDILVLVEFSSEHYRNMQDYLEENYPYNSEETIRNNSDVIFSKLEIVETNYVPIDSRPGFKHSVINVEGKRLNVIAVHTPAPINTTLFENRNMYLEKLAEYANDLEGETIIVGDMNITPWSEYYNIFITSLDSDFVNPTTEKVTFTWNIGPFFAHIDHAFLTKNLRVNSFETYDVEGSDHKALFLKIQYE